MWLGAWRNRTDTSYNFKWPQEPIRALGVFFSYNSDDANNLNFGEKNPQIRKKRLIVGKEGNLPYTAG